MINAQLPAWLNMSGAQMMGEYENLNMMRARRRALAQQMQMAQQQLDQQTKERQDYNRSVKSLQEDFQRQYAPEQSKLPPAAKGWFDDLMKPSPTAEPDEIPATEQKIPDLLYYQNLWR